MTRKELVSGLRSLHEDDTIENIKLVKRSGAIVIDYTTHPKAACFVAIPAYTISGQLIIADPTHQPTKKPKG